MALGSFGAQNSDLKRDARLALDQPAEHDFTAHTFAGLEVFIRFAAHSPPV